MSGDNAPHEIIKGAVAGGKANDVDLLLVGNETIIRSELSALDTSGVDIEIYNVEGEPITMEDDPGVVIKSKKDSSMAQALKLLSEGAVTPLFPPETRVRSLWVRALSSSA